MPDPIADRTEAHTKSSPLLWFALAALLLPLVVAVFVLVDVGDDSLPTADFAYTELLTRDVGHHEVMVGLYSREDWDHPGPALFYALALPYRLTGGASIGIYFGALLINGAAIVGMALIARRRGGTPLMIFTVLGILVLARALGADFLRSPWNPYVTVLPFGLMIFLSWAMTCRDTWALPVGAAVASFLAQTHIGYVVLALPLFFWGAAWLVPLARRQSPRRREVVVAALIALGVGIVMWLPPVLDQVLHEPGNLGRILNYFRHPDAGTHSLATGYRVVMGEFGLPPEWISGARKPFGFNGEHLFAHTAPPALLLVPFAIAVVVLWRKGTTDARRLISTLLVAFAVGILAVMRTNGELSAYRLRWTWMLATLAGVIVLWAIWTWCTTTDRARAARGLVALTVAGTVALVAVNTVAAARAGIPREHDNDVMAALLPPSLRALPAGTGDVLVRYSSNETRYYAPGIVLGLERAGVAAKVDPDPAKRYGPHRIHRIHGGGPVRAIVTLVSGADTFAPRPQPLVAFWGNHSKAKLKRSFEHLAQLQADLAAGKTTQRQVVRELLDEDPNAVGIYVER